MVSCVYKIRWAVTGGGRGISRDIVLAYAQEGARLVVNDIDPATATGVATEAGKLGSKSFAIAGDISAPHEPERVPDKVVKQFGHIDIVVNNAMRIVPGKLEELPESAWDTTMNIGNKAAFLVGQSAAKQMIPRKPGCLVNIASVAGLFPYNWAGLTAL